MKIIKKNMIWIKRIIKLTFVVSTSFFMIAIIEFSLGKLRYGSDTYIDWLNSKPKAFRYESNYDVIKDSLVGVCKQPPLVHIDGLSFHTKNFSCGGLTYLNGKRITLPEIKDWNKTLHIFGGSTVMGVGADDKNTIPSLIQTELQNNKIRVINHGVSSFVVNQQNKKLIALQDEIRSEDIVVYYDGGNDFWNGVMLGNPDGTIVGFNAKNRLMVHSYIIRNWLSNNSNIYVLLSDIKHGRIGSKKICDIDTNEASERINKSATHYAKRINEARVITSNIGAKFIHFYQPTLFNNNLTEYEETILSQNPCWVLASTYKNEFDRVFLNLNKDTIDLKNILQNTDTFFDYIHTSSLGNEIVSDEMMQYINVFLK